MKNTTKTIAAVLAVFLAAALFVGAASAADTAREIDNSTAFVYENINITGTSGQGYLNFFDKDGVFVTSIASNATTGVFNLLDVSVGSNTGIWYYGTTQNTKGDKTVNIQYPKLSIDLRKGTNSLDGQSIIRGESGLVLVLDAPYVTADMGANVSVLTTTPEGGKSYGVFTKDGNELDPLSLDGVQTTYSLDHVGSTVQAGTYTVQAEFKTGQEFGLFNTTDLFMPAQYKKSNTITVTINSADLTITAAKDSVIRSNPFTVTVTGEALKEYYLIVETTGSPDGIDFLQNQKDVTINTPTNATIKTDASGKIQVEFSTTADTEDKTYTIKVYGMTSDKQPDNSNYDTAKIKVEKGAVTVSASGDGSYYIGDEITLSGTNTDSSDIWLFITGPNLMTNGEVLKQLPSHVDAGNVSSSPVSVKTDDTWEYKWNTADCGLDTGAYTVYATSTNVDKSKLSDTEYATVSINLKQPFLSAVPSGTIVAKGDKIYIRGTAEGEPSTLQLYIFGPNKYVRDSISVEDDGSYEKKLDIGSEWSSNQYFVVIEHPMYNGKIDVDQKYYDKLGNEVGSKAVPGYAYTALEIKNFANQSGLQASFIVEGTNKLQGSNAADALTKMIDSANIDDIYTKLTFTVAEPWIKIENPGDQATGSKFTITGTTNLAVDDQILVEVVSSSFNAIDKTSTSITDGISMTTKVVAGEGTDNVWSVEVDTTNWKLDEYTIKASGIEVDVSTTTNFNLVEKVATPTATATATGTTTATATATATATPATPGFGAFVALAGLGAVALLVLRRN